MTPKNLKRPIHKKMPVDKKSINPEHNTEVVLFSPQVNKIYKIVLRTMSWIVGLAILMVIVFFYFNSPLIDRISQVVFYIGIVTLILFIIIELVSIKFKIFLSKILNGNHDAKNIDHR